MVDTAVLFISPSKRLLEGSEARVNAWNDSLGECLDTDQYATVFIEFELNFDKPCLGKVPNFVTDPLFLQTFLQK